ncbi:esterase/lipase family protein [Streptomyces sp. NPDC057486]|uniref:esterase/lipase family protein n=1 Tax=Streptomyces sp. NPDC057486 TaxID=3346145 RepID=UPI0036C4DC0A
MAADSAPTVVLVHGAFADAGSWSGGIAELQNDGIPVVAPPNPLRGLVSDAAYVASVASQIDGPVVLVGHSYGGARDELTKGSGSRADASPWARPRGFAVSSPGRRSARARRIAPGTRRLHGAGTVGSRAGGLSGPERTRGKSTRPRFY